MNGAAVFYWARLVVGGLGLVPAVAFVLLTRPTRRLQRPLPQWVTWIQSLALSLLSVGIVGSSAEALLAGDTLPAVWWQVLTIVGLAGLLGVRVQLAWWWLRDRWGPEEPAG